jgi:N-acetyl-1-D-myo-inositol-2-amino-2-deoxy-alpha-D-glucopyranoside deacetylase
VDGERVLFVHAHPDDESISTGGTIATLAARGAHVILLVCTRGELGEVVAPDLASRPLGEVRRLELENAARVLGVREVRWLGGDNARLPGTPPRRYRDSGMRWGADGRPEPLDELDREALTSADFADVAADIATVIADTRPDAVVSYDEDGGYGHPDHVLVAAAARRAAQVMVVPFWAVTPTGPADLEIDVTAVADLVREALAGYRSQLIVDRDRFAGANGEWVPLAAVERYRRLDGPGSELPGFAEAEFSEQGLVSRGLITLGALLFGAVAGTVLTAAHGSTIGGFPVVAVAGLLIVAALLSGLRVVFAARLPAFAASVGLVAASVLLSLPSTGGSELVGDDLASLLWMFGAPVVVFVVMVSPQALPRRTGRIDSAIPSEGPAAP